MSKEHGKLSVSETADYLQSDGRAFFYLADTVWCAFTSVRMEEWEEYLDYRRMQGFNALQINVLPQWDASSYEPVCEPFEKLSEKEYDYHKINGQYFDRAAGFLKAARDRGFTPALVLLWCNFVPDTWGSQMKRNNPMPLDAVRPYVEYVVRKFAQFDPIYIISGDTDFQTEQSSLHYMTALETVKALSPESLTTMHIGGERHDLPEQFIRSAKLDFYTYQSGHRLQGQHFAYDLAQAFMEKEVKKPIVNAEPCYEGHGYGNEYGRFTAFDVRKAVWQSLLSGAKAGVTYGAHGVWNFHRPGSTFESVAFSSDPLNFREALRFEGAWDVGFAKWIFEHYGLFDLEPKDLVLNRTNEIRLSISKDENHFAVYIPYTTPVSLKLDLSEYDLTLIELSGRRFLTPETETADGVGTIKLYPFLLDSVVVGTRKQPGKYTDKADRK